MSALSSPIILSSYHRELRTLKPGGKLLAQKTLKNHYIGKAFERGDLTARPNPQVEGKNVATLKCLQTVGMLQYFLVKERSY